MHVTFVSSRFRGCVFTLLCGAIGVVGCSDGASVVDGGAEAAALVDRPSPDVVGPADVADEPASPDAPALDAPAPDASPVDAAPDADAAAPDAVVAPDAGPLVPTWSRRFGAASDQDCLALALDASGNVLLATFIIGTVDFGNGPLSGFDRIAIAKLSPAGATQWSRIYPNGGHHYATGIGAAPSGAVVIAGSFENTLNFGGTPLVAAGGDDIFSAGFTAAGATSWSRRYGDATLYQRALDLAVDSRGEAVFVGRLNGTVNFGGAPLTGANSDIFVVKVDAGGNHVWSRAWGDAAMQVGTGVAVDASDNVLVVGQLDGRVDLGGGPIGTGTAVFLAKLSAAGGYTFARAFATTESAVKRTRVAADAAGNIYVAGNVRGTIDFGGGPAAGGGDFDVFVAKFDPAGRLLWHHEYGDAAVQELTDIAVDAAGNVALTGCFDGVMNFGGGPLTSLGGDEFVGGDVFVAKLGADGAHRFSARYGDAAAQRGQSVAIDARGDLVVAGEFRGAVDFGDGPLTSAGGTDIFVARIRAP